MLTVKFARYRNRALLAAVVAGLAVAVPSGAALSAVTDEATATEVENLVNEARRHFEKGDLNSAEIQIKNALQKDTNNVAARTLLARIYLRASRGDLAERHIDVAREAGGNTPELVVLAGEAKLLQNQFDDVIASVNDDYRDDAIRLEALILRGRAFLALRQFDDAQKSLDVANELKPTDPRAKIGLARMMIMQQKPGDAEQQIDAALLRAPDSTTALIIKGELRRLQKDLDGSVEQYTKAITVQSENPMARLGRAIALIDLQRDDEAEKDLDAVFKYRPKDPMASYLKAMVLAKRKEYQPAQDVLQNVGPALDNHLPAIFLRGAIHYALDQLEQATTDLGRFVQAAPENVKGRKLLGAVLLKKRDVQRALDILEPAVRADAKDAQLYTIYGSALMQAGRFAEATEAYRKAAEISPDAAAIRTQLALGSLVSGNSADAVDELERALNLEPESRQAALLLALAKLRGGDFDGALVASKKLLEVLSADNPVPHNLIGTAYLGKKDYEAAKASFNKALEIKPDFEPAHMNLAQLAIRQNDYPEAARIYNRILERAPGNVRAYMGLADLAKLEKKPDEAVAFYRQAIDANPKDLTPRTALVEHYIAQNDLDKALQSSREADQLMPNNPQLLQILGRVEIAAGDLVAAEQTFKRLANLVPDSAAAQQLVARTQLAAKQVDDARETLKRAIYRHPDNISLQINLIQLEMQQKNYDEALRLAETLRRDRRDEAVGDLILGDVQMGLKQYDEAAKAYKRGLEKADTDEYAIRLFQAVRLGGDADGALKRYEQWVGKKKTPAARHRLAGIYISTGKYDDAIRESEGLLEDDPNNPLLLNNLAWLYQQKGQDKAIEFAERAYKAAPNSPSIMDTLGWMLLEKDATKDRAFELLQRAAIIAPKQGDIRYHFAAALHRVGKTPEACHELSRLFDEGIKFAEEKDARSLRKELACN